MSSEKIEEQPALSPNTSSTSDSHIYSSFKHQLNWYYDLKDPSLHKQHLEFQTRRNSSLGFMYYINIIQTFLGIPAMFVSMWCDFMANDEAAANYSNSHLLSILRKLTGVCTFICLTICTIALWYIIFRRKGPHNGKRVDVVVNFLNQIFGWKLCPKDEKPIDALRAEPMEKTGFWTASNIYYITGQTYYTLLYVRKVFHCFAPTLLPDHVACFFAESLLQNFIIDPYLLIIVPVLNWVLVADIGLNTFWVTYTSNLTVVLLLETFASKNDAIVRLGMTIMLCLFFIIDIQVRNVTMFFTAMDLNYALKEVKRMEEENRKNEMRNMIANVAHDMKTVSVSLIQF